MTHYSYFVLSRFLCTPEYYMESDRQLSKRERVELNRVRADAIRSNFLRIQEQMKICIDCSFMDIMNDGERRSLAVQIQETYSHLRQVGGSNCQLFIASANDWLKSNLSAKGGDQWALHIHSDPINLVSQSIESNILVLSPDATEELSIDEIQDTKNFFVIGGIVDRVVSRNETAHKAIRLGVRSRRIPISEGIVRNRIFNIDSVAMFLMKAFNEDRKRGKLDYQPKKVRSEKRDEEVGNTVKLDRYTLVELFR
jgi:Trm5-related predicted tRNA methylase